MSLESVPSFYTSQGIKIIIIYIDIYLFGYKSQIIKYKYTRSGTQHAFGHIIIPDKVHCPRLFAPPGDSINCPGNHSGYFRLSADSWQGSKSYEFFVGFPCFLFSFFIIWSCLVADFLWSLFIHAGHGLLFIGHLSSWGRFCRYASGSLLVPCFQVRSVQYLPNIPMPCVSESRPAQ